jgi:hypothetical protein
MKLALQCSGEHYGAAKSFPSLRNCGLVWLGMEACGTAHYWAREIARHLPHLSTSQYARIVQG